MEEAQATEVRRTRTAFFLKGIVLLMSAYFVFWACGNAGPIVRPPPMGVTHNPNKHQLTFGGGRHHPIWHGCHHLSPPIR